MLCCAKLGWRSRDAAVSVAVAVVGRFGRVVIVVVVVLLLLGWLGWVGWSRCEVRAGGGGVDG